MSQPAFSLTPTQRTQRYARLQERFESPSVWTNTWIDRNGTTTLVKKVNFWETDGKLAGARFRGRQALNPDKSSQMGLEITTPDGRNCWRRTDEISVECDAIADAMRRSLQVAK